MDPSKTEKVRSFPRPTSAKETSSFYGLVNWFKRHVPHFSKVMALIQELLWKDRAMTFKWRQEQKNAFIKIKEILTSPPVLILPDYTKIFYLCTDASEKAISAIFCQKGENGALKPISYAFRSLTDSEFREPNSPGRMSTSVVRTSVF